MRAVRILAVALAVLWAARARAQQPLPSPPPAPSCTSPACPAPAPLPSPVPYGPGPQRYFPPGPNDAPQPPVAHGAPYAGNTGANTTSHAYGAPPPAKVPSLRSPAMANAGYALFALAAVVATSGVVASMASQGEGDLAGMGTLVGIVTTSAFALSFILTGIPLVAVGSQAPAQPKRAAPF